MNFKSRLDSGFARSGLGTLAISLAICCYAFPGCRVERESAKVVPEAEQSIPLLGIKILKTYPHDPHAFTQGLEYFGGFLYESTGETGQAFLPERGRGNRKG